MPTNINTFSNKLTLAIHSTDNSFGFACRENNNAQSDIFFIKRFNNDLSNNLIVDFNKFISKENLKKVNKISVSIGPANFNASRLIVVLARTLAQQLSCPLEGVSAFELMSKRIALSNNIFSKEQSFCIYKKLKRKGFIAGKYKVCLSKQKQGSLTVKEKIIPKVIQELWDENYNFLADYDDQKDLKELLNLSNMNIENSNCSSWEKVLPLYPMKPFN